MGKKCTCILLKTNITNGYITIYKNQLDLFVFSVIFTTKWDVFTLIQTSTLFIYSHVFNQKVKVTNNNSFEPVFGLIGQTVGVDKFQVLIVQN